MELSQLGARFEEARGFSKAEMGILRRREKLGGAVNRLSRLLLSFLKTPEHINLLIYFEKSMSLLA